MSFEEGFMMLCIGIIMGGLLATFTNAYSIYEKATKQETNNSVIYTYSWEVLKANE